MLPLITMTPAAYVDLILAIDLCEVEISGLGDVERREHEWKIISITVIPQRCSMGSTKFDPLAYNLYLVRLAQEGRIAEINSKGLWWHSHVRDATYFSGTDRRYIERTFGKMVPSSAENPWLVSIVGNKFHRLGARLDIFRPHGITYENLPVSLIAPASLEMLRKLYQERKPQMEAIIKERITIEYDRRGRLR